MEILFNTSNLTFREEYGEFDEFIQRKNSLKDLKVDEIRDLFDLISKYMSSKDSGIKDTLIENELGFIIFWLKKSNINIAKPLNFSRLAKKENAQLTMKCALRYTFMYFYGGVNARS